MAEKTRQNQCRGYSIVTSKSFTRSFLEHRQQGKSPREAFDGSLLELTYPEELAVKAYSEFVFENQINPFRHFVGWVSGGIVFNTSYEALAQYLNTVLPSLEPILTTLESLNQIQFKNTPASDSLDLDLDLSQFSELELNALREERSRLRTQLENLELKMSALNNYRSELIRNGANIEFNRLLPKPPS